MIVWTIATSPGGVGSSKKFADEARSSRPVTAATSPNVRGIIKAQSPTLQSRPMKKFLGGQCFGSDEEVKSVVHRWLYAQKTEFYKRGVLNMVSRWEKCVERLGFNVEE